MPEVGRRILLVDDEEALAHSLTSRLARARPQHRVSMAMDGESALAHMQAEGVELLIADIRMPGMSGIDLALTARATTPDLPVVMMTAFKSAEVQRITPGPFTGFLEKPFEFESLLELVDRALAPNKVGFSGAISVQTLPDIVQLYALSSTTGVLRVEHKADAGEVWFDRGAIVHAVTRGEVGDDAFYAIMMWTGGEFSMRAAAATPERSVRSNWQELLMESCRRLDERLRDSRPPSRTGWTHAPPPPDDLDPNDLFGDIAQPPSTLEITMNIKDSLTKLNEIDGFVGAALVDSESGMLLGQEGGGGLNLEVAAAGNTEVVRAKRKVMNNLALKESIEDILISLNRQYHLIRPLRSRPALFFYVALDRARANLAMARIALADVEKDLTV